MSKIGHASIGSNGKISGDTPGDQGKEVCIINWYSKPWSYVLRPKDNIIANKMATACEKGCANNAIGYDQSNRNSLKTQAVACSMDLSKITTPCECDCSSFMTVCAECAGIQIPYNGSNAPTTSTMKDAFMSTGQFDLLTDQKYLTSDNYLKRGDVLVKPGSHTAMVLENGIFADNTINDQVKVVDVSKYNTITNYTQLAKEIPYIIIRIGFRAYANGKITEDPSFEKHITNALANNMAVGIYFYDQSLNEKEAEEQADWVLNRIKNYKITLPIYIDSEAIKNNAGRADNISVRQRTNNVIAFCNKIINGGHIAGVYAANGWFQSKLIFSDIQKYNIWCARYSTQKPTISKYDAWQYGSEYYSWATDKIDSNYFYNFSGANTHIVTPSIPNYTETPMLMVGVVTASTLNVRSIPSTNGIVLKKLTKNSQVTLSALTSNNWYKLSTGGYVSGDYIKYLQVKVVNCNKLNVRSTPSSANNSNILKSIPVNTTALVMSKSNGWYQLLFSDNTFGWCSGKYIKEL